MCDNLGICQVSRDMYVFSLGFFFIRFMCQITLADERFVIVYVDILLPIMPASITLLATAVLLLRLEQDDRLNLMLRNSILFNRFLTSDAPSASWLKGSKNEVRKESVNNYDYEKFYFF